MRRPLTAAVPLLLLAGERARPRSPTTTPATSPTPTGCSSGSTRCGTRRPASTGPARGGVDAMSTRCCCSPTASPRMQGHHGPARNDHRARSLARALVSPPAVRREPAATGGRPRSHAPGWVELDDQRRGGQHLVFDAEVVDGLVLRLTARRERSQLPDETATKIARRASTAPPAARFWRWPTIRLNQINWYALMYAADATVTGDTTLLRARPARAARALLRAARAAARRASATSAPACASTTSRTCALNGRTNLDSAEYANIVALLHALLRPGAPRAACRRSRARRRRRSCSTGSRARRRLLDARRLPELGHRPRLPALAPGEEARARAAGADRDRVLGPAAARARSGARWAKSMLDHGFDFYERARRARDGGAARPASSSASRGPAERRQRPARPPRGWRPTPPARSTPGSARSARAAPPPLYAFDPDIGRLAVTTPAYNTAIVAVNQRRLPVRRHRPRAPVRRRAGGRREHRRPRRPPRSACSCATSPAAACSRPRPARPRVDPAVTPLRLTRAPRGAGATAATRAGRALRRPVQRPAGERAR